MTYNEFKKKYKGKLVNYDGAYGGQCWDLAQQYFVECLGLPEYILGGCGLVNNMMKEPKLSLMKQYFDIIPLNEKKAGDVEIFDWGHIAIMDHWNANEQVNYYFTQNTGTANNPQGVAYVGPIYDNENCMCFRLKKKTTTKPATTKPTLPKPVAKNDKVEQVEVLYNDTLRARTSHAINNNNVIGMATKGFYNILSTYIDNTYTWFEVEKGKWLASVEGVLHYHKIVKEEIKEETKEEVKEDTENTQKEPVIEEIEENKGNNQEIEENGSEVEKNEKQSVFEWLISLICKFIEFLRKN